MDFQKAPVVVTPIEHGFHLVFDGPIHTNTAWLESEFDRLVKLKPKLLELDLTGTEYISSMGLGILVGLHTRIKADAGKVRVVKIKQRTLNLLKYAFLHKLFEIDPAGVIP
jgi:anti-anti-sigma factor